MVLMAGPWQGGLKCGTLAYWVSGTTGKEGALKKLVDTLP
jgi:hypothetical protein